MATKKKSKKKSSLTEREQKLVVVVKELNKAYGEDEPFITPCSETLFSNVGRLSTGLPKLDRMLGGGFPEGKNIELFGPQGGGKSTLALHFVGEQMRRGKSVIWFDVEDSLEIQWARKHGMKVLEPKSDEPLEKALIRAIREKAMLICKPQIGEHCLDAIKAFCGLIDIVIIDSVPALTPKAVLDGSNLDKFIGVKARMISQGLDQIVAVNKKEQPTTIVWINQLTTQIGSYGNPETTPGGRRLKFYCRLRLGVRKVKSKLDERKPPLGQRIGLYSKKNSYYPPYRKCQMNLMYGGHFDLRGQFAELGEEFGFVERRGSYLHYGGEKRQGLGNFKTLLRKRPQLCDELTTEVMTAIVDEIKETTGIFEDEEI